MKKFLLSAAAVTLMASGASASSTLDIVIKDVIAATVIDGTPLNPELNKQNLPELEYMGFKFSTDKGAATQAPMYNKAGDYRVYGGSVMTISAPEGSEMSRIVFNVSEDGLRRWPEVTASQGDVEVLKSAREVVWSGSAQSVSFTIGTTAVNGTQSDKAGIFQFDKVMITTEGEISFSSSPSITPEGGKYPDRVEVTISAGEGAKIYYTTDGTSPSVTSAEYTAPFELTESATVKAIAVEEGKNPSNVVEQEYVILHGTDILTLRTFLDDNPDWTDSNPTDIYNFKGEYTVAYQNGRMLFIGDETAGLVIAGAIDIKYEPGDVITGFRGTFRGVNGVPQLRPEVSTMAAPVRQGEYVWAEGTYADVTDRENMSRAYVLRQVYYTTNKESEANTFGFAAFNNDDKAIIYNGFSSASEFNPTVSLPEDGFYDIYGFVSGYKKDNGMEMWFLPVRFDKVDGVDEVGVAEVVSTVSYDLAGRRITVPARGVRIERRTMADGSVRVVKVVR